ncbi:MAG: dUTP diphosphatase [Ferruginibacter sp.]
MEKRKICIKNISNNPLPEYATSGSSGLDLRAFLSEPIVINASERKLVPTGIMLEIPIDMEGQIRPRSGLAVKHGITCLNSPGTIDSDYRGELKVLLINLGTDPFTINNNDRIAQLVISRVEKVEFTEVSQLKETVRNEGGFGHTGMN